LKTYLIPGSKNSVIDAFHTLYYDSYLVGGTWSRNTFLGTPIQKCPMDLQTYQEILYETKPDLIIECGTAFGGGALYLASLCDLIGVGEVVTIDVVNRPEFPKHPKITYLTGSSTDPEIVAKVRDLAKGKSRVMVILDSDHRMSHVLTELELYHSFVTAGCYLIVEDTNVNGHPVRPEHGEGPYEALTRFLEINKSFEIDKLRESGYITFNPSGYLKKIKTQNL